jgi:hypothetical protein
MIPATVDTMQDLVFEGATKLQTVDFEPLSVLASVGNGLFKDCSSLQTIPLPGTLTTLLDSTFLNCTSLAVLSFPSSITTLGKETFKGCTALLHIVFSANITTAVGTDTLLQAANIRTLKLTQDTFDLIKETIEGVGQIITLYGTSGSSKVSRDSNGAIVLIKSVGNSGGDPYIRCVETGTTVKLPDCHDVYRMYQNPRTGSVINCQVDSMKTTPDGEPQKLGDWAKAIEKGYFFTKLFIYDGVAKTSRVVDLNQSQLLQDKDLSWRQEAPQPGHGTENLFIGDYTSRTLYVCDGGEMDLRIYPNPSIRNDLQYVLPGNMDGLLYKNYRPKVWRRNTLRDTKMVKMSSRRPLTRRDIVGHREVVGAVRNQKLFYEMFVK